MRKIVNLENAIIQQELSQKISNKVIKAIIAFSDLQDKGRFISGVDFSYLIHEVLPPIIRATIKEYVEQEDENV